MVFVEQFAEEAFDLVAARRAAAGIIAAAGASDFTAAGRSTGCRDFAATGRGRCTASVAGVVLVEQFAQQSALVSATAVAARIDHFAATGRAARRAAWCSDFAAAGRFDVAASVASVVATKFVQQSECRSVGRTDRQKSGGDGRNENASHNMNLHGFSFGKERPVNRLTRRNVQSRRCCRWDRGWKEARRQRRQKCRQQL